MRRIASIVACAAAALVGAGSGAHAQTVGTVFLRDRDQSVLDRPRPEYESLGIREAGFTIYPRLRLGMSYDDNVLALNSDQKSDGFATIDGRVNVQSNWSRNSLFGFAEFGRDDYLSQNTEDRNTYGLGGEGRYDLGVDAAIEAQLEFHRYVEPRTAEGAPQNTLRPVRYDQSTAMLRWAKAFNRLKISTSFDYEHFNYFDSETVLGARFSQNYRDHDDITGKMRADYAISPATALFVEAVADVRRYKPPLPTALQVNRDNSGFQLNGGANFEFAGLARGEINAGYFHQSFDDPRIADFDGPGVQTKLELFPSQLTTVTLALTRILGDSGDISAPIFISTGASARVDHELLRNVILSAGANYTHDDYEGVDRTDDRYGATASATYLLNRWLGLRLDYLYQRLRGAGTFHAQNYDINRVSLSAVLQY